MAGFFDLLHSGHIRFFEAAARYGRVIVSIGSDKNSLASKGRNPVCSEDERQYMVSSVRFVDEAHVAQADGPLSFAEHIEQFSPEYFIINRDGHTEEKQALCENRGVNYVVLERTPVPGFESRSSTDSRGIDMIPHRLDLAGGFFDQKKLNRLVPGTTVICNIEPMALEDRSGMSSSTRRVIRELFGNRLPSDRSEQEIANIILAYENFDTEYISGATDAYGLVFSSVCKFGFHDSYRPHSINKIEENTILNWLENHLYLKLTHPRPEGYQVFDGRESFPKERLCQYKQTARETWAAIKAMDLEGLQHLINETRAHQERLIPGYISEAVRPEIQQQERAGYGVKLAGAGGAGYMIIAAKKQPPDTQKIVIRRRSLAL